MQDLMKCIENKKFAVGAFGLEYDGLLPMVDSGQALNRTLGIDGDQYDVGQLNSVYNFRVGVSESEFRTPKDDLMPTVKIDFSQSERIDPVCAAVPNPLRKTKDPGITCLFTMNEQVEKCSYRGLVLILENAKLDVYNRNANAGRINRDIIRLGAS
ncbi:MAG: hypothetical protein HQ507_07565 [Candidatus Marinimicrobia bacterium]|nr:hypothetical protein [Candidatus Neomarinimicrobiota bacterium]